MAINKRVLRILRETPLRYIGILVLIVLGSYTFVLAAGLSQNLDSLVTAFIEDHRQEDLSFSTDREITDLESIEKESGAIIEGYLSYDAALTDTLNLRLLSETEKLNIPAVTEGKPLARPGEILLDPAFVEANGYQVGSQIEAAGKNFTVAGLVSLPHYIFPVPNVYDIMYSPDNFGVGVIKRAEFTELDNPERFYSVHFTDRTENISRQAMQLREILQQEGIVVSDWIEISNNRRANIVWASITGLRTMSIPMPAAMFLLCCLITGIMIWRMVRREAVIIGTFYAQGYRRRELMAHYMVIPLLLAFAGGITGSTLALPSIAPSVMAMITYYNVPVTNIELSILNLLIGTLTPVIFLGLSSYLVIRLQLKRSPVELMKGSEQNTQVNFLERVIKLERFKFKTKFQLREQMRSISRLLFLLLGVASASVLMLFGFTIMSSFNQMFQIDGTDVYFFEYEYTFRELQYGEAPPEAEVFNASIFYPEQDERIEFWLTGIEPDSTSITLKDNRGNPLSADQTNITKTLAERLGIEAGDKASFIHKEDGREYSFRIDAIADTYVGQFIFMPIDEFNKTFGYPEDSYIGLFSTRELNIPMEKLSGTKALSEISGAMDELLGPMIGMIIAMTLVSCVVALIIIYLVTSLLIEESKATISLLKVFGYKRREIHTLILNSSTLVILAGFLIGVPVALASFGAVYGYVGDMINLVLPTVLSPLYVLICFVLIMLTYQLSKRLSAKNLDKISMSEAIKAGTE